MIDEDGLFNVEHCWFDLLVEDESAQSVLLKEELFDLRLVNWQTDCFETRVHNHVDLFLKSSVDWISDDVMLRMPCPSIDQLLVELNSIFRRLISSFIFHRVK